MKALDLVEGWGAPDAAVAVVAGDEGVVASVGDRALRSRWASVTKLVTALAALVAVEEHALGLDDPAGPPGSTVRHLLAHASGLAYDEDRVLAPPGERRIYSNTGFGTLAREVAARTGMTFERYLTEAVLEPLGMPETRLEEETAAAGLRGPNAAAGLRGPNAAAGLRGPLEDMIRLAAELLSPTLVSAPTFELATAEVAFPGLDGVLPGVGRFRPLDWGLGFELKGAKQPHWTGRRNSAGTFGHFGGSGSFLWVDPARGVACVALSRRDFGSWALEAWPRLADAVLAEHADG